MKEMMNHIGNTFPEGSGLSMTLDDVLREEGMEIGIKKGREEGIHKSLVKMTHQGLFVKFKKCQLTFPTESKP